MYFIHRSSEAKLNNFMRLEPTFRLLEIPFNINMVWIEQSDLHTAGETIDLHVSTLLLCV